jgi:hypothetical protein
MGIQLFGHWDLTVTKAIHNWENRFRVEGAATGSGTYPPSGSVTVDGAAWQLIGEYRENASSPWKPSEMMIDPSPDRVAIRAVIGSEDPLPSKDFEDIQWDARFLGGTLFEIPYRPYAVRPGDLFQMPDGIFETALGTYYMAVRIVNRWGLPFGPDHVLDISPQNRVDLAMRGIHVQDAWTQAELATLGQSQLGTGMVVGPLNPGASRTLYFKVDMRQAAPRKHEVEFVLRNITGMADPAHPARRVRKQIFVSRTTVDASTGEIVAEVQEGTLRFKLKEFALDTENGRKQRHRCQRRERPDGSSGRGKEAKKNDELRTLLTAILEGKRVDPCTLRDLLECTCACHGDGDGSGTRDPGHYSDGTWCLDPFFVFPTKFSYTVTPRAPFEGQYGPIPYDDPWWKVLLLVLAAILLLAGAIVEAADVAYQDEDLVIGTLGRQQGNDVDAALCEIDTDRALAFLTTLDAQSDEDFQNAVTALDGDIALTAPVVTRAELDVFMALPLTDPQRKVHKSGARTGLTHAVMTGFAPNGHDKVTWGIDQLLLGPDPDFGSEPVSQPGDSGSVWVHTASLRPVALHHSGDGTGVSGFASLLEDVQSAMDITI